jgi:hypothetical protein
MDSKELSLIIQSTKLQLEMMKDIVNNAIKYIKDDEDKLKFLEDNIKVAEYYKLKQEELLK